MTTEEYHTIKCEVGREADQCDGENSAGGVVATGQFERFGKEIEEGDPYDCARTESQDEVELVFESQCQHATSDGGEKSGDGDEENHTTMILQGEGV